MFAPHLRTTAALCSLLGCAVSPVYPPEVSAGPPPLAVPAGEPTRILSAHAQPPGPAQRDYFGLPVGLLLYVVFSRPLDPASLAPGRFVTLADNGSRRVPVAARFAPSSELDELRAVELVLPAPERTVLSVTVSGQLFDLEGRDIEGLSADVAPATAAPVPVLAERLASATACGPGPAVRVWWSVPVSVGPGEVRLGLSDGRTVAPKGRGDLACAPGPRLGGPATDCDVEDDNVTDYCLPAEPAARIDLDPGAARDRQGGASAGASLTIPT